MSLLLELKKREGQEVLFEFRGKLRPFILRAVQDVECDCSYPKMQSCPHLINGKYLSDYGEVRLDYNYEGKREWEGFWTNKLDKIVCD